MFKRNIIGFLFVFVFCIFTLMALLSQEYNPFLEPMSNLGIGSKGIFFNLGLMFSGIIGVFVVYERYKYLGKILIVLGIFTMISLSLTGVFPAPVSLHGLFAGMMFTGMILFFISYIVIKHSFLTLIMIISFIIFLFYNINLSEWIIFFTVNGWMFVTSTNFHYENTKRYIKL